MNKKRILIISEEGWRDEENGGNVLSNLFGPLINEFEFAQIYTRPVKPKNDICKKYYHLSIVDMMRSVLLIKKYGYQFDYDDTVIINKTDSYSKSKLLWMKLKQVRLDIFYLIRDLLFTLSRWKTTELKKFINDFNPDIIFAPMYGSLYMHQIDRFVAKETGKKLISYVSDDHLTYKQYSWSPLYWIYRLLLRKQIIKTSKYYSLLYTMTDEQKEEYESILNIPMKVLKKAKPFEKSDFKENINSPIRLLYAGNISSRRYETLGAIRLALEKINFKGKKAELVIYTQSPITSSIRNHLHDGFNSFLMGEISADLLEKEYQQSDILLHVESFNRKERLQTRLSFSTKLIDLMHACRCIVAICWSESSPYKYLKKNDLAFCITSKEEIEPALNYLFANPTLINNYAHQAWNFGVKYHKTEIVSDMIRNDFLKLMGS